jgi:hypothetical protein
MPFVPALLAAGKVAGAVGSIGSALGGLFGGRKKPRLKSTQEYMNMGQEAFNTSLNAGVSSAMPQFQDQLQDLRESAIRRGVEYGDIGTRNEGSLASAFQRNIANAAGSNAIGLYQTALDQRAGRQDQLQGRANARAGNIGALGQVAGQFLGSKAGQEVLGSVGGRLAQLMGRRQPLGRMPTPTRQRSADVLPGMRNNNVLPDPMRGYKQTFGGVQRMP